MPIESIIRLKSGLSTEKGFSRIVGANVSRYFTREILEGESNVVKFELRVRDWASAEMAEAVWKERQVPNYDAVYDDKNPLHVAQWIAYQEQSGSNPPAWFTDPLAVDENGKLHWQPTETKTQRYWDGETVGEPLGPDRSLSFEIPVGADTQIINDEVLTKLYLTAMQLPGAFEQPKNPTVD